MESQRRHSVSRDSEPARKEDDLGSAKGGVDGTSSLSSSAPGKHGARRRDTILFFSFFKSTSQLGYKPRGLKNFSGETP